MQKLIIRSTTLLAGVIVGIGCFVGVVALVQDDETSSTVEPPTESQETKSILPQDVTIPDSVLMELSTGISVPSSVGEIVFPKHAFDRNMAIVSWVATLSNEQILNWLEQTTDPTLTASSNHILELQTALVQRFTISSPDRAFEYAQAKNGQERRTMTSSVLETWSHTDLDAALSKVKETIGQQNSNEALTILRARDDLPLDRKLEISRELTGREFPAYHMHFDLLYRRSDSNPKETWYTIVNVAKQDGVHDIARNSLWQVAPAWVKKEGFQVFDEIISSISNEPEFSSTLRLVLSEVSEIHPERVFDYVLSNFGDRAQETIIDTVVSTWVKKDPIATLAKGKTLPEGEFRQEFLERTITQWSMNNPRQLFEQLDSFPAEHVEYAGSSAIMALARSAPEEMAEYVLQVSDHESKVEFAKHLIAGWSRHDSIGAKDWVLNLPGSDPLRNELIVPLANTLLSSDPRTAFQLALTQPIEKDEFNPDFFTGAEVAILTRLAGQDLDLAKELLPQMRADVKPLAFHRIASSLIQQEKTQDAIDLGTQLPVDEHPLYYQSVANSWGSRDPQGFLKRIDDLPSPAAKSRAAFWMNWLHSNRNLYSETELGSMEKYINEEDATLLQVLKEIDRDDPTEEEAKILTDLWKNVN